MVLTYCDLLQECFNKIVVLCERFEDFLVTRDVDENRESIFGYWL